MQDKTAEKAKNTRWANWLLAELQRRTGRHDIGLTVSPNCSHDVLLSVGADKHPVVSFHSAIQGDSTRVAGALDYVSEMLQSWELTVILHEKASRDCLLIFERLKREFPHMQPTYNIVDSGKHCAWVTKTDDKIKSFFDLWPKMTEGDVERLISHIKDIEDTLNREGATYAEVSYFWKV